MVSLSVEETIALLASVIVLFPPAFEKLVAAVPPTEYRMLPVVALEIKRICARPTFTPLRVMDCPDIV